MKRRAWAHRVLRSVRGGLTLVALGGAAAIALGACNKPKAGDPCDVGQAVCLSASDVMACQGGVFVAARCRGPGGCSKLGSRVSCDDAIADEGDSCLESNAENRACSGDKKASLLCTGGKFKTVQSCRGPNGCQIRGDAVTCDSKLAAKGDPCTAAGTFACTPDLKARLVCAPAAKSGSGELKFALGSAQGAVPGKLFGALPPLAFGFDRYCRGPSGCHALDLGCDETISDVGDPCGVSGMFACTTDGRAELECEGGQYVKDHSCPKSGCKVLPQGRIECL